MAINFVILFIRYFVLLFVFFSFQHSGTNFTAFRLIDTNKDEVKSVIADIVAKEIIQAQYIY